MKLLEQLKAKGIAKVTIAFDGSGDSGGVEEVYCYDEKMQEIEVGELKKALIELGDAIIKRHDNQINFKNEGCFGEVNLDVESGKINIVINARYIDYETECKEARVEEYLKEDLA